MRRRSSLRQCSERAAAASPWLRRRQSASLRQSSSAACSCTRRRPRRARRMPRRACRLAGQRTGARVARCGTGRALAARSPGTSPSPSSARALGSCSTRAAPMVMAAAALQLPLPQLRPPRRRTCRRAGPPSGRARAKSGTGERAVARPRGPSRQRLLHHRRPRPTRPQLATPRPLQKLTCLPAGPPSSAARSKPGTGGTTAARRAGRSRPCRHDRRHATFTLMLARTDTHTRAHARIRKCFHPLSRTAQASGMPLQCERLLTIEELPTR